jgi:hypothetical protein
MKYYNDIRMHLSMEPCALVPRAIARTGHPLRATREIASVGPKKFSSAD